MVFSRIFALTCLFFPISRVVVNAHPDHHAEQLRTCGVILHDLPEDLASSFCSSYAGITDATTTHTSMSSSSSSLSRSTPTTTETGSNLYVNKDLPTSFIDSSF